MPSIWMISRSSPDRSAAIHSFMRSADSATNRRDTADLDTPEPLVAGMSPPGKRAARPNFKPRDVDQDQIQRPLGQQVLRQGRLPARQGHLASVFNRTNAADVRSR